LPDDLRLPYVKNSGTNGAYDPASFHFDTCVNDVNDVGFVNRAPGHASYFTIFKADPHGGSAKNHPANDGEGVSYFNFTNHTFTNMTTYSNCTLEEVAVSTTTSTNCSQKYNVGFGFSQAHLAHPNCTKTHTIAAQRCAAVDGTASTSRRLLLELRELSNKWGFSGNHTNITNLHGNSHGKFDSVGTTACT
jgi:hypothetical protein